MRDAMGGTTTLVIIVVFIVFALGYMAFNVNYTKAFRMKDKIISIYDKYSGNCDSTCNKEIENYAKDIAYSAGTTWACPDKNYTKVGSLYCYKKVNVKSTSDGKDKYYYKIITRINIQVPIINNVLNLSIFYIRGDTKTFEE